MHEKLRERGCVFIFLFLILIESQAFVPNIPLRVEGIQQSTLAPVSISKALGIVKSNSRDKQECDLSGMSELGLTLYYTYSV